MSTPVLPHEVRELRARLPRWVEPFNERALRFARRAPGWVPPFVRWMPLRLGCYVVRLYARGWL